MSMHCLLPPCSSFDSSPILWSKSISSRVAWFLELLSQVSLLNFLTSFAEISGAVLLEQSPNSMGGEIFAWEATSTSHGDCLEDVSLFGALSEKLSSLFSFNPLISFTMVMVLAPLEKLSFRKLLAGASLDYMEDEEALLPGFLHLGACVHEALDITVTNFLTTQTESARSHSPKW